MSESDPNGFCDMSMAFPGLADPQKLHKVMAHRMERVAAFFRVELGAFALIKSIAEASARGHQLEPPVFSEVGCWQPYPVFQHKEKNGSAWDMRVGMLLRDNGDTFPSLAVRSVEDEYAKQFYRCHVQIAQAALRGEFMRLPNANTSLIGQLIAQDEIEQSDEWKEQQEYVSWVQRAADTLQVPRLIADDRLIVESPSLN